jgi:hypothetical protein
MEGTMTDTFVPAGRFAESDFRAGHVFNRTFTLFSRNWLPFCLIALVASLPNILVYGPKTGLIVSDNAAVWSGVGVLLAMVLNTLSQAALLYAAFDDMRGRPVDLVESFKIGLRRFFPVLGVAICVPVLAALALVFPGFMVLTMSFVAGPVCVVERLGPIKSMERSARLTKGHRWKIFGLWLAVLGVGGHRAVCAEQIVWRHRRSCRGDGDVAALLSAFGAILVVVTYHDLRVAKEGVSTDQIAAVFD